MTIRIWVDGSVHPSNPGNGGLGVFIRWPDGVEARLSAGLGPDVTNNEAELIAIHVGLCAALARRLPEGVAEPLRQLELYSDSEWALNSISGRYRAKTYLETIDNIRRLLDRSTPRPRLVWVRGHAGNVDHDAAHDLAYGASSTQQDTYWDSLHGHGNDDDLEDAGEHAGDPDEAL